MQWQFKDVATAPPGGWVFIVFETNSSLKASSYHGLAHKIILHYKANSIMMGNPFEMIANQLCEGRARPSCYDNDDPKQRPGRSGGSTSTLNWGDMWSGGKNLSQWFVKGSNFVSQEIADARASQCVTCPRNQHSSTCISCGIVQSMIENSTIAVKNKSTRFDKQLKTCQICKCSTKVLAHTYDTSYMNESITSAQRSEYEAVGCWKLKNG